jgi:hypothetical protein
MGVKIGDFVRVHSRDGWWPVWLVFENKTEEGEIRVMIQDGPGDRTGPCVVLEVWDPKRINE